MPYPVYIHYIHPPSQLLPLSTSALHPYHPTHPTHSPTPSLTPPPHPPGLPYTSRATTRHDQASPHQTSTRAVLRMYSTSFRAAYSRAANARLTRIHATHMHPALCNAATTTTVTTRLSRMRVFRWRYAMQPCLLTSMLEVLFR